MNNKSNKIKEVIPGLLEKRDIVILKHYWYYWSIAISDSKILLFKTDDYYGSDAMFTSNRFIRLEDADRLIGDDIERIIAKVKTKYVFSREPGKHLKFKVVKKWLGPRKLLLEDDTNMVEKELGYKPKILMMSRQIKELQEAVPELEIEYIKE
jgi:hypothetical protein